MTAINSNRAIRGPVTAVPVVAGKGVRLVADTENNRWVVEADETVLFSVASGSAGVTSATLSESLSNFERVRFTVYRAEGSGLATQRIFEFSTETTKYDMDVVLFNENDTYRALYVSRYEVNDLTISNTKAKHYYAPVNNNGYEGNGSEPLRLLKVVGINRIASN